MINKKINKITLGEAINYGVSNSNVDNGAGYMDGAGPRLIKKESTQSFTANDLAQIYLGLILGKIEKLGLLSIGAVLVTILNLLLLILTPKT